MTSNQKHTNTDAQNKLIPRVDDKSLEHELVPPSIIKGRAEE